MTFDSATPVLQVSDVARSIAWYRAVLGFDSSAFPESEPYSFAILNRDRIELMLQLATSSERLSHEGWSTYIRLKGHQLLELANHIRSKTALTREPERMPYGDVEFAVADPDGHEIVLSELLPEREAVPAPKER